MNSGRGFNAELGLMRLNEASLRPGDIILITTTARLSAAIRVATRSDISHAMVYVDDRSVIDATAEGVHAGNTQRLFIEEACPIHVLRLKDGIRQEQFAAVEAYLRGNIGTRYSKKEAVLTALGGRLQWSRQQFCSRLVAQAFAFAGIQLVSDPNFCSPEDLKASLLLTPVPDVTVPVTAKEAAWWDENEDVPQLMRDATNTLLEGARERSAAIETFDDLHSHLVANPDQDEDMCCLLETSGYLSVWRVERAKNPWQYDLTAMSAAPISQIEDYCWSVLASEDGRPNRYVVNRGAYSLFTRQYGLRFFQVMTDLYERLATLHRQRVDVATQWLEANGHLDPLVSAPLTPHSAEWFAELERWDPAKAIMTRAILKRTGRADVCSICGDEPATDYRLEAAHRPAGGVDTLRLCGDCVAIRRATGEPFVALPLADNSDVTDASA